MGSQSALRGLDSAPVTVQYVQYMLLNIKCLCCLKRAERVAQASALGSPRAAMPADDVTSGHQQALQFQLSATRDSLPDALR